MNSEQIRRYDLLLQGATVIDPSTQLNGPLDIAIDNGTIAKIAPNIADPARRTIELKGKIITPGLIDMHVHVMEGSTTAGVAPDIAGVHAGVTTLVDTGSGGCATFEAFPKHIIPNCKTEIVCFMHIGQTGLATLPDIKTRDDIDLEGTIRAIERHREIVCGVKVRMVSPALEVMGMELPKMAKKVARETGTKLMVHIGDTEKRYPADIVREMLPLLGKGDVLTHLFTENPGGVLDHNKRLVPEAVEAASRGVWLDTAHGRMNFSFDTGQRVLDQGMKPHCISTDLTTVGRRTTVHSLVEIMTRFLALGFNFEQVVTMVTENPAKAINQDHRLGSLVEGRQADITVLDIKTGKWAVYDVVGGRLTTEKAIVPVLTIKRGEVFTPEWGPRPWGWEPERLE